MNTASFVLSPRGKRTLLIHDYYYYSLCGSRPYTRTYEDYDCKVKACLVVSALFILCDLSRKAQEPEILFVSC